MKRQILVFIVSVVAVTSALADHPSPNWSLARRTATDFAEDVQKAYMKASRGGEHAVLADLFRVWGEAGALHSLISDAPSTREQVYDAARFVEADLSHAADTMRRTRVSGATRAAFDHARDTFDRLMSQIGLGEGGGYEEPVEPVPTAGPELTLASDGWHGNFFERYTRLSGSFRGMSLTQADLIVTDGEGYSLWHRNDAFPEIKRFYETNKFIREGVVSIPFNMKFYLKSVPQDAAWIYVRLRDGRGNYADEAIPIPR